MSVTTTVCELSDLPADQCACRVHGADDTTSTQRTPLARRVGAPFTARYVGPCQHCDEPVQPGDAVAFVDDELVCGACAEDARSRR